MSFTFPKVSQALRKSHAGESVAIFQGEVVAVGKDSFEAEKAAEKKGYPIAEILTAYIMGEKNYVL